VLESNSEENTLHWIGLAIVAVILWVFGRILTDMANAGQWWIFPIWFVAVFSVIYFIGADEDRAYYHRAAARIKELLRIR